MKNKIKNIFIDGPILPSKIAESIQKHSKSCESCENQGFSMNFADKSCESCENQWFSMNFI